MTNEQILKKVLEKVAKNDYKHSYTLDDVCLEVLVEGKSYYQIIFSHDFAKAFWGKDEWYFSGWRGKLKELVLEKEPLKYLEKFL